ncbi:GTPase HflX [Peptoniphilus catoniae]|uniref:GTPase HflX n=1 Tax=Peptoniphilus catoniae TaxID=1660341 RepID=UPI0010FD834C|nr:GTPase HflX [Peptoniphilus catoniae]
MEKIKDGEIEKAIVVATDIGAKPYSLKTSLEELEDLTIAAGAEVRGVVAQNIEKFSPKYLIGTGKVKEIKDMLEKLDIDLVIFNDELSGIQVRNLEKNFNEGRDFFDKKVRVIDRTNLILDIFAQRASTYEGKLQVELAQLEYQLPRLLGIDGWSRTGGGIGTRGPGEQIIETDRRRLLKEIDSIKAKLKKLDKTRDTMRNRRTENHIHTVSLVGYTNAGKSTILNRLKLESSKEVYVKDMLFATLDPNSRRAKLLNGSEFIISDTVGFVSKLPTKLVEAFKSTLEEIKYSDLILHVIDASSEDLEIQYKITVDILKDLGIENKKILTVFNKMDRVETDQLAINPSYGENRIYISAKKDENMDILLRAIEESFKDDFNKVNMLIAYDKADVLSNILDSYKYENLEYKAEGVSFTTVLNSIDYEKYKKFVIEDV